MFQELIAFYCSQYPSVVFNELKVIAIVDENFDEADIAVFSRFQSVAFITNRWDIYSFLKKQGATCEFSDFDVTHLNNTFDACFYRVSKERAVCHHVFNQALGFIKPEGILCVGGKKSEGTKGYHKKLTNLYEATTGVVKNGDFYAYNLKNNVATHNEHLLDDKHYKDLRELEINAFSFFTKPGQYGWNKVDAGSKLLMDTLLESKALTTEAVQSILDLGCGYGYLSTRVLQDEHTRKCLTRLVATDNNAAAIRSCKENVSKYTNELSIDVITSDCADNIHEEFDVVVCNPPFHQGFENDRSLTHKFLKSAARHLVSRGKAYFVVNSFIPLEQLALDYFSNARILLNNKQFKLVSATR